MMKLEVFDPAMCCSTGVCGPSVDPALATFAADLDWVSTTGAPVRRYNLGQEPGAFAERAEIRALLHESGDSVLPVVVAGDEIRSTGRYPSRAELAAWAGLETADSSPAAEISMELISELAAIGAAVGANCEPCLKYHYAAARKLGLTNEQLTAAVRTAQLVKEAPAGKMLELAAKLLRVDASALVRLPAPSPDPVEASAPTTSACCGPDEPAATATEATGQPIQIGAGPAPTSACC